MKGNCLPIVKFDDANQELHLTNDQDDFYTTIFQTRFELDAFIEGLLEVRNNHFPVSRTEQATKDIRNKYVGKKIDIGVTGRGGGISGIVQDIQMKNGLFCVHIGPSATNYIIIQNVNPECISISTETT